jgi:peroxiredoxin
MNLNRFCALFLLGGLFACKSSEPSQQVANNSSSYEEMQKNEQLSLDRERAEGEAHIRKIKSELKGQFAPDFELNLLDGTKSKLSAYRGKTVVLSFFFVNCPACLVEIPSLNHIQEMYGEDKVAVLSLGTDAAARLKQLVSLKKINYTVSSDSKPIAEKYGVQVFPTNLIVDKNGVIEEVFVGSSMQNELHTYNQLQPILDKLVQE